VLDPDVSLRPDGQARRMGVPQLHGAPGVAERFSAVRIGRKPTIHRRVRRRLDAQSQPLEVFGFMIRRRKINQHRAAANKAQVGR